MSLFPLSMVQILDNVTCARQMRDVITECFIFTKHICVLDLPYEFHSIQKRKLIFFMLQYQQILGWPKSSFGFFHYILWKNLNRCFAQPKMMYWAVRFPPPYCLLPVSGRSPRKGNGNPLQYSCLESSMNRGAWWATVHGVAKSWTRLSMHARRRRYLESGWRLNVGSSSKTAA